MQIYVSAASDKIWKRQYRVCNVKGGKLENVHVKSSQVNDDHRKQAWRPLFPAVTKDYW